LDCERRSELKIIAIDPGPRESAFVWFDGEIHRHGKHPNVEILDLLKYHSRNLLEDYCVIEMIASYGMPVGAEVFETCVWIGRFMQAYDVACTRRITRGEVKMHLCHSMKAKDGNIRQALIDRFGPPGTKKNPGKTYGISGDVWAALAVAVTFYDKNFTPTP
jgi:hypothetical protein